MEIFRPWVPEIGFVNTPLLEIGCVEKQGQK